MLRRAQTRSRSRWGKPKNRSTLRTTLSRESITRRRFRLYHGIKTRARTSNHKVLVVTSFIASPSLNLFMVVTISHHAKSNACQWPIFGVALSVAILIDPGFRRAYTPTGTDFYLYCYYPWRGFLCWNWCGLRTCPSACSQSQDPYGQRQPRKMLHQNLALLSGSGSRRHSTKDQGIRPGFGIVEPQSTCMNLVSDD